MLPQIITASLTPCVCVLGGCGGGEVLKYEIGIYVSNRVYNGELGSGPSLKMWGFQSGHSREKEGILKLKTEVGAVARRIPVLTLYGSTPPPPEFNLLLTTNDKLLVLAKISLTFS